MNNTLDATDPTATESTHQTTSENVESEQPFSVFLLIQFIVGILGILGNSLVCIVFLSRRSLRNQTNLLITNQAFIDLLSSILIILYNIYSLIRPIPPGSPSSAIFLIGYCYIWRSQLLLFSSFAISTFNLTAIASERYVAIIYPVAYGEIFARRRVKYVIAALWLAAPTFQYIIALTTISLEEGVCVIGWAPASVGILVFLWEFAIPVCIMMFCFVSILRKFRSMSRIINTGVEPTSGASVTQHVNSGHQTQCTAISSDPTEGGQNRMNSMAKNAMAAVEYERNNTANEGSAVQIISHNRVSFQPSVSRPNPPQPVHRPVIRVSDVRRRNVTMTLLVVFAVFIVCWSPNQLAFIQANLGGYLDYRGNFYQFSVALAICNTCVNPFIYALRHKAYKERLGELFGALRRRCCS